MFKYCNFSYLWVFLFWRTSKVKEKPSTPNSEHPALVKMWIFFPFFVFCGSFLPSWVRIQPTKINMIDNVGLNMPRNSCTVPIYDSWVDRTQSESTTLEGTGLISHVPYGAYVRFMGFKSKTPGSQSLSLLIDICNNKIFFHNFGTSRKKTVWCLLGEIFSLWTSNSYWKEH